MELLTLAALAGQSPADQRKVLQSSMLLALGIMPAEHGASAYNQSWPARNGDMVLRVKLTKRLLFSLPEGVHVTSNCFDTFSEQVGPAEGRGAMWQRVVAARANGRLCVCSTKSGRMASLLAPRPCSAKALALTRRIREVLGIATHELLDVGELQHVDPRCTTPTPTEVAPS